MPLSFHFDRRRKMEQQRQVCREAMIPFIRPLMPIRGRRVLELGCGEGGVLAGFVDVGATGVGIDLSESKIAWAQQHFSAEPGMRFYLADIYTWAAGCTERFDIVILKDVIEHVTAKRVLLQLCRGLLKPGGLLFVGFPPWKMPFGGHQQMADTRLGKMPWMHLTPMYRAWLKRVGEQDPRLGELLELPTTALSTDQFEQLAPACAMQVAARKLWLINPIYRSKFRLPALPLPLFIPHVSDVVTTAAWYALVARD